MEPDLLSVLGAFMHADPHPPGFDGRLAVGVIDEENVRWLLVDLKKDALTTERSEERLAPVGFDCIWLMPMSWVDGDQQLLARVRDRYFKTRSRLGFQMQQIANSRGSKPKKKRSRS